MKQLVPFTIGSFLQLLLCHENNASMMTFIFINIHFLYYNDRTGIVNVVYNYLWQQAHLWLVNWTVYIYRSLLYCYTKTLFLYGKFLIRLSTFWHNEILNDIIRYIFYNNAFFHNVQQLYLLIVVYLRRL